MYDVFPAKDDLLFVQIPRLILHNQQAFIKFGRSLRYVENDVIHQYKCQKNGRQPRSPGDESALFWLSDSKWLNISHVSPRRNGRSTALKHSKNRKNTTLFGEFLQNYTSLYLLNLPRNRQMKTETSTKIISKHNMNHHFNADDSQLYLTFKPSAAGEPTSSKLRIESCIHDVNNWMLANKLMLNHDKSELLVLPFPSSTTTPARIYSCLLRCDLLIELSKGHRCVVRQCHV